LSEEWYPPQKDVQVDETVVAPASKAAAAVESVEDASEPSASVNGLAAETIATHETAPTYDVAEVIAQYPIEFQGIPGTVSAVAAEGITPEPVSEPINQLAIETADVEGPPPALETEAIVESKTFAPQDVVSETAVQLTYSIVYKRGEQNHLQSSQHRHQLGSSTKYNSGIGDIHDVVFGALRRGTRPSRARHAEASGAQESSPGG
jgi:hypothetical protein